MTSVPRMISAWARHAPDTIAVHPDVSYGDLNARANRLAGRLRARGAGPGEVVAVWLPRSTDLVVALLAILKTGAGYLPLDPGLGSAQLDVILAGCQPCWVLTAMDDAATLPTGYSTVLLDPQADAAFPADDPAIEMDLDALFYVIYTSGSTGRPKGVEVSHANVANLCNWAASEFDLGPAASSAVVCGQSFDASVLELWPALTVGARLVIADEQTRRDPKALADWYTATGVTFTMLPTALGEAVLALPLAAQPPLRHLALGGDVLRRRPHVGVSYTVTNLYGPTEVTVLATRMTVPATGPDAVPIGFAIDNVRLLIRDDQGREAEAGELFVGGAGVALGYRHAPELTAERFVDLDGELVYRTGDLVRINADGALEFRGRTDDQVKIRGYRVEPGEVTHALVGLPEIADAIVLACRDARDEAFLAGYVVPASGVSPDGLASRLTVRLAARLPDYLVPTAWAVLDRLPLNANGKLDRSALPELTPAEAAGPVSGADEVESAVLGLFGAELSQGVDLDTSFFELGGHSVTAMRLLNRIRDSFAVDYPAMEFFRAPTVRAVAGHLRRLTDPAEIVAPVSFEQAAMARSVSEAAGASVWNMPFMLMLRGELDIAALRSALDEMVLRHHGLRSRFIREDGVWRQEVLAPRPLDMPLFDVTDLPEPDRAGRVSELCRATVEKLFDLSAGRLFRATLLHTGPSEWRLVLVMQHIVADGWSLSTLLRELAAAYRAAVGAGPALPPVTVQPVDYTAWQRTWLTDEFVTTRLPFWMGELADIPLHLPLPTDRPRPASPTGRGRQHRFTIPATTVAAVAELARRRGSTSFAVISAALGVLLSRLTGRTGIALMSPYANRRHTDYESVLAVTAWMMVVRLRLAESADFADLVSRTGAAAFAGIDQLVPLGKIYEAHAEHRGVTEEHRLNVMFAYQNTLDLTLELPGLETTVLEMPVETAGWDLAVELFPTEDGGLRGQIQYALDLFDAATVESWAADYTTLLAEACADPSRPLAELVGGHVSRTAPTNPVNSL